MAGDKIFTSRAVSRSILLKTSQVLFRMIGVALVLPLSWEPVHAQDGRVLTDAQIAAAAKPATVVITTSWKTTVSVPKPVLSRQFSERMRAFAEEQRRQRVSSEAIVAGILQALRNSPNSIVATRKIRRQEASAGVRGSGFIVTPDGYIVTNAHVVAPPREEVEEFLIENGLDNLLMSDLKEFSDDLDFELPEDMTKSFLSVLQRFYMRHISFGAVSTEITARMGSAGPFPCDVRKLGEPTPGKDVAILKIENHDLPTISLGDDSKMRTGDHLVVLGYPGAADLERMGIEGGQPSGSEPTLTQGDASARKTMPGGWGAIQTSAEINHGNSGGPAFNTRGEVIGVATFGPVEAGVRGINFLVPTSVVRQFLNEINVKPEEGRVTKLYKEALAEFEAHRYRRALALFREINDLNPGFPFVQQYLTDAQAQVSAEPAGRSWQSIALLIVALIGLVAAGLYVMRGRRLSIPGRAPTRAQIEPGFGSIQCSAGAVEGRRFPIPKQGLLIGKDSSKCQIVLADDTVSREHAWVVPLEGGVVVIDRDSSNGVYVNSTDSPRVSKVRLQHGDRIFIGKGTAVFTYFSS
jgi:serine protease Do